MANEPKKPVPPPEKPAEGKPTEQGQGGEEKK